MKEGALGAVIDERIEQFKKHCERASYHHADDSGKEWGLGAVQQKKAQDIYDNASGFVRTQIEEAFSKGGYLMRLKKMEEL